MVQYKKMENKSKESKTSSIRNKLNLTGASIMFWVSLIISFISGIYFILSILAGKFSLSVEPLLALIVSLFFLRVFRDKYQALKNGEASNSSEEEKSYSIGRFKVRKKVIAAALFVPFLLLFLVVLGIGGVAMIGASGWGWIGAAIIITAVTVIGLPIAAPMFSRLTLGSKEMAGITLLVLIVLYAVSYFGSMFL